MLKTGLYEQIINKQLREELNEIKDSLIQIEQIFVREYKKDISGTSPYTFLGIANYINHEGSRPMNITWKLERPIPAKFMKKSNKLMVG